MFCLAGADEGAVFTALPHKVTAVTVALVHVDSLQRVSISVDVGVDGGGTPGTHVLLLEVTAADGATAMSLLTRKVVGRSGRWTGVVPFDVDEDLAGITVSARDVATGLRGKVVLG